MRQIAWCPEAENGLARAAGSPAVLEAVKREVLNGEGQLWQFDQPDSCGYVVTRVEETKPSGMLELVIVLGEGCGAKRVIKSFMKVAKDYGIESMRTHIKRPGLKRIYERLGWSQSEIVMRFNCNGK
ncbi:hypothetical protein [Alkalimarinus coralli]|uniref:hypothetical protein n=1 Tax=Alkalimarinus coralli TaxID=2935863 RepID=UPI00202B606E|nr:hypothetical protein [Alkalimarinus coralli]